MNELEREPWDLIITGVGGQGNVLASQVLGRALLARGYTVTVGETFGLSQRGGAVMSMVRITRDRPTGPLVPEHRADVIVSLEPLEALRVLGAYGHPRVIVMTNDRPLLPLNVIAGEARYPEPDELRARLEELSARLYWLPATQVALEVGAPILANVVILGALAAAGLAPVAAGDLEAALARMFPPDKMEANRRALARGAELVAG